MSEDLAKLREDFNKHQIADARFESSTAAYIKNAAEDIRDITGQFTKATDAQWDAIKELGTGLATEREERMVSDTKQEGKLNTYAKVVGLLISITLIVIGSYAVLFRG